MDKGTAGHTAAIHSPRRPRADEHILPCRPRARPHPESGQQLHSSLGPRDIPLEPNWRISIPIPPPRPQNQQEDDAVTNDGAGEAALTPDLPAQNQMAASASASSVGRMLQASLAAATAAVPSTFVSPPQQVPASPVRRRPGGVAVRCAPRGGVAPAGDKTSKLRVGSPIVILEAPVMLKTAASVPSLRHNGGQVKPGDVGRYVRDS